MASLLTFVVALRLSLAMCRFLLRRPRALRLYGLPPRRRRGRCLRGLRLVVLADHGVMRLVAVLLAAKRLLLLELLGIPISRILPLVDGQRSTRRCGMAIPLVPPLSLLPPIVASVLVPARRRIRPPPVEVRGRCPVVAHRDSQHI